MTWWRERRGQWLPAIVVAVVAAVTHANGVLNSFTLDDDTVIMKHDLVRHLSWCWRAFAHPYWPENTPGGQYRPLAIVSFAVDWAVSGGSPHWMHAVNVLWHVAACVLIWRLLREMLPAAGALAGALYFAVQPVHIEAIANTVGRCDLMAATFVIAGVLAHRRGSWLAVPLYAAALASKESGVVLPGLVAASDLILGGISGFAMRGRSKTEGAAEKPEAEPPALRGRGLWMRQWPLYAGYIGVLLIYGATLALVFRHHPLVSIAPAFFRATLVDRWLTEARVVLEYIRLMLFPLDLKIEYSPRVIDVARGLSGPVVLGLGLTVGAAALLVYSWRRAPAVAFGLAWFAIAVSPVSNILFASGVVLAERTLYLPTVGAAMIVGWVAWTVADRVAREPGWAAAAGPRRLVAALGVVILGAFAVRSWTRTEVWHDDKRLLLASLLSEPESYRTHVRAATILDSRHDWPGAEREFGIARTLFPDDPYVFEAAAMVADMQGQFSDADRLYDSASLVRPGMFEVYSKQARMRFREGQYAGAIQSARRAYMADRDSVGILNVLTGAAQRIGDFASADWAFRRGLADHPSDTTLHRQYSWMLAAEGDTGASRREAIRAMHQGQY
jgi:protein O-mannosyl-transferase